MAKKRAARPKKKRRRGRGGTSTLPGSRPAAAGGAAGAGTGTDPSVQLGAPALAEDPWMAQQRQIDQLQGQVDRALAAHQSGQLGEAEAQYREVLETDPLHFDALRLLAAARLGQGDPAAAVDLFERASQVGPLDAGMRSNMGFALKELGRFDEAITACEEALQADPEFVDARFNLAAALFAVGRFEEAVAGFQWLIDRAPTNGDAWYNKGRALTGLGEHDDSVTAYARAADLDPTNVNYLLRLGMARQNAGDQWAAARAYDRALALDPDNHTAYFLLGHSQYDQGYKHEAIDAYRKAIELKPDYVEALSNLGSVLRRSGERQDSLEAYARAVEVAPGHVPAHFNLANVEREYGDHEAAERGYKTVIELSPDHFGAHVNLSSTLLELGRVDEAADMAREGLKLGHAPDPELAWQQLASALLAGGDVDGALNAWDSALEAKADDRFSLCAALAAPLVLEGPDDRIEVAQTLAEAIDEQNAAGLVLSPVAKALDVSPADLSGHGRDDRELLSKLEQLLRGVDEELHLVAGHCHQPRSDPDAPLRIGLVSARFSDPDEGLLALGLARAIPRDRASVKAFAIGEPQTALGRAVMEAADEAEVLSRDFLMSRNRLCESTMDVLIYVGPTRSSLSYCLAFVQAARVQIGVGADADCGLSTLVDLGLPGLPLHLSKPDAGAPAAPEGSGRRYVCSRPLADVVPEFDALAAAVLSADPQGTVVVRSRGAKYADAALLERMAGAGVPTDRVALERADDVPSLTALFDGAAAVLEPPGHGYLPTTALALATGTPTVALSGDAAALPGVRVASGAAEYASRAVEGAPDAGDAGASLWDEPAAVIALVDALEAAVRAAK